MIMAWESFSGKGHSPYFLLNDQYTSSIRRNGSRSPKKKDTHIPQSSVPSNNVADEAANKEMDDRVNTPQSDEDRLKLNKLMEFCTKLQQRVLDLENTKTAQAQEITSLKLRVKNLEKKGRGCIKQGRKLCHLIKMPKITLVNETQGGVDEVHFGSALAALNKCKQRSKAKGLVIHEEEQATTPTVSSQQPSQVKAHDKGKRIMVEELVKTKKKDQISLDEELAFKLQAEEEEERLAREKAQQNEEANIIAWDNVQAMIDADYQMAQQMQTKEQEKLSIEKKSKLFVQLLEARKKHFAAIRAQEERNKPLTKVQKRNTMSTYLKNMAGYKHNLLKKKSFNDIQKRQPKARVEGSSKRGGEELEQESSKMQKLEEDKETSKLQRLIEVVPDKEEVAIDAIPLATKPPSIVDYKIHKEGKKTYYQIIRVDGSLKMYLVFNHMLKSFLGKGLPR
ncbi:hypothetical protein Tco_0088454 [Tanacetum coccineum]